MLCGREQKQEEDLLIDRQTATLSRLARKALVERLGADGQGVRILYGGSVKPSNAAELMGVANVNGALVGGASLKCADFMGIACVYK